jgi:hypothetical protein
MGLGMMTQPSGQQLIDSFFSALALMQLEQCQEQLEALTDLAKQDPAYGNWSIYLTGVLANERDRDWAEGESFQNSQASNPKSEPENQNLELWFWLLLVALILWPLEIAWRRWGRLRIQ